MSAKKPFDIGSSVRVTRPNMPKAKGRGTVATIQDDTTACVLWESIAPKPLNYCYYDYYHRSADGDRSNNTPKRRLRRPFLVTPLMIQPNNHKNEEEEIETSVPISELNPLLDFEQEEVPNDTNNDKEPGVDDITIAEWKERGDQLLRLGDASAACSYYEMALRMSSILQVGSAVIVKQGGYLKIANVDCFDGEDEVEISMQESDEERVVTEKDILLCILFSDAEDHIQERILLNLARCCKQLADLAKQQEMASERRPLYLKSAVLATTLALTIAEHHKDEDNTNAKGLHSLEHTALLLRSQAQASLAKFPHAIADIKKVLNNDPQDKEGLKQLQNLQVQQQRQKMVDKKLVKSMCKWVKTAADNDDSVSQENDDEDSSPLQSQRHISASNALSNDSSTNIAAEKQRSVPPVWILGYVVVPLLLAYLIQQLLG